MRNDFLPFALPDLDDTELQGVAAVLCSGWLTTGPRTREFEAAFAAAVGGPHAVAVNSCTAAMHLALDSVGLKRGDEVITSPYTFAATAEVIRYFDARPVFVDVDPDTLNIRPDLIERAISERTRAIIPVHVAGFPAEMEEIERLAAQHELAVIEDAAHAFPAGWHGRRVGEPLTPNGKPGASGAPWLACFSFYATKTITTGEGGMIVTDSEELADRCRMMALHGISKDAWKRYSADGSWYYEIMAPGYKYNMTDIAAAIGMAQLAKAARMRERREWIARRYSEAFAEVPQLQVPAEITEGVHAWHLYMLRIHQDRFGIDRGRLVQELKERNIGCSVHFIPLHIHPYYRETFGYEADDFPVAYREYQREVSLPIYSRMTDADVDDVIGAVTEVVRRHAR